MPIFNSLGSNYDFTFVWRALITANDNRYQAKLKNFLEEKYKGKAVLVYKGREALRLALRAINQQGSTVGICGFTCYAVYDAVIKEGYKVNYLDIDEASLHFSFETFKKASQKNPHLKILIIQNTLGLPCEIENIAKFCREREIILIEDLAHSIGTKYANGREAGTVGNFVALSFSQDKVVDGVSGGALILRDKNFKFQISNFKFKSVSRKRQVIDRLYPLFTFLIRKTYVIGLGKMLHMILKRLHLLSNPMSNHDDITDLPSWYCQIIYNEFIALEKNLSHRKKIAGIYADMLDKSIIKKDIVDNISSSTNLRFPIFVNNRQSLIAYLKNDAIFVSDIWYDVPIAPKKYFSMTNYKKGDCTNAEKISSQMLNLPTHRNVSEKDAKVIAEKINQWLQSQ